MNINNLTDLSRNIGINSSYLNSLIYNSHKFYNSYYLRKKSGGKRMIDAPSIPLKSIQAWILRNILENISISDRAFGFVKSKGIKNNAKVHLGKKYILCTDIRDFFHSTSYNNVKNVFKRIYKNQQLVNSLSNLCTYNGYLPQGAVTSPCLSNIIFKEIDDSILSLCNKKNIYYSRYADDLTFSSNDLNKLKEILPEIIKICNKKGYKINNDKTRFMSGKKRIVVTGIILNSNKLSIGRRKKKNIRAALHNYIIKKSKKVKINSLLGDLAFLRDIEPNTHEKFIKYKNKLKRDIK
jgi:RNA-directed DNA polymerase